MARWSMTMGRNEKVDPVPLTCSLMGPGDFPEDDEVVPLFGCPQLGVGKGEQGLHVDTQAPAETAGYGAPPSVTGV